MFVARYAKRRPNVQIKLTEAIGASLMGLLERGEVHIVVTTAGAIESSRHSFETIWLPSKESVQVRRVQIALEAGAKARIFALNTATECGRIEIEVSYPAIPGRAQGASQKYYYDVPMSSKPGAHEVFHHTNKGVPYIPVARERAAEQPQAQ